MLAPAPLVVASLAQDQIPLPSQRPAKPTKRNEAGREGLRAQGRGEGATDDGLDGPARERAVGLAGGPNRWRSQPQLAKGGHVRPDRSEEG